MGDEQSSHKTSNGPLARTDHMANSHQFDDVAHIRIRLGIGNHQHTVCINSLMFAQFISCHCLKDSLALVKKGSEMVCIWTYTQHAD